MTRADRPSRGYIGQPIAPRETLRFVRGQGRYVSDLAPPDAAHAAFLRSPHAHARISEISVARAKRMPGVLCVLTGKDWDEAGLGPLPGFWEIVSSDGQPMHERPRPVLVRDKVCHVGDTVAAVVAETHDQAKDAVEAIAVDYDPLPVVTDTARALDDDAAVVHQEFGTNLAFDVSHGDRAAVEAAFSRAAHVTTLELVNNRVAPAPIEPRAVLGQYDATAESYTLWTQSQCPHLLRTWLARESLRVAEHRLRVISPDVGGAFGQKIYPYPEEPVVLWASQLLRRPVRWVSSRLENLLLDTHGRDHATRCSMALDDEGGIIGLKVDTIANIGAYLSGFGACIPALFYGPFLSGQYDIPAAHVRIRAVYTNTTRVDAYRGAGRPEAIYVVERLIENAARETGVDVCELRARNVVRPEQFPYRNAFETRYDSGDYPGLIEKLKAAADYEGLVRERDERRGDGLRMGIGLAGFVDSAGGGKRGAPGKRSGARLAGFDAATVRVSPAGGVTVYCGGHSHGQSHPTTFAQIVADRLGCHIDDITVVQGDTDRTPYSNGTYGSRTLCIVGISVVQAVDAVIAKGRQIAAHMLGGDVADIEFEAGEYRVRATNRFTSFAEVAHNAHSLSNYPEDLEAGLEATAYYEPSERTTPSGMHLCTVLVDTETGVVKLRDFWVIDDVGRIINSMVVTGQIHGGIAQGIGQALMEHCVYGEDGQALTGSFLDYAMPRASDLPNYRTLYQETLSPDNPLGVKGGGETGAIGAPAAVANAVVDALWDLGVRHIDMPLTPMRVWQALGRASGDRRQARAVR